MERLVHASRLPEYDREAIFGAKSNKEARKAARGKKKGSARRLKASKPKAGHERKFQGEGWQVIVTFTKPYATPEEVADVLDVARAQAIPPIRSAAA